MKDPQQQAGGGVGVEAAKEVMDIFRYANNFHMIALTAKYIFSKHLTCLLINMLWKNIADGRCDVEIHDLKNNVAVFPGQGSQVIGMGQDFYSHFTSCRHVFEEASATLGFDVAKICFNDEEKLNLTEYTQPCILARVS